MFDSQLVITGGRAHIVDRSSKRLTSSVFPDYHNYQQSLELRDLVKDSIYREVQSLSAKSEHVERRELLRSLSYRNSKEGGGSSRSISSDAPRFSYDGREANSAYYNPDLKSSFARDVRETQGNNEKRLPSVVARLMGLEALPDSSSTNVGDNGNKVSRLSEKAAAAGSNSIGIIHQSSGKNPRKEPISPRWRSSDVSMKPLERFPLEPAPWRQNEKARFHTKLGKNSMKDRALLSPSSVYSEIDKRLKELEFLETGKDLRALKQIMEAIHGKGLVGTLEEGHGSHFPGPSRRTDQLVSPMRKKNLSSSMNHESPIVIMKPAKLAEKLKAAKDLGCDRKSNSSSFRNSGERSSNSVVSSKNEKSTKTTLASASRGQQHLPNDGNGRFGKRSSSGSVVSPRTQKKKLDMEKRSQRPPTPPSSVKPKVVKSNKKQAGPESTGVVRRRTTSKKNSYLQGSDDQLSESSVASSSSSYYATEIEDSAQLSDVTVHWPPHDSEASSSRRSSLTSTEASEALLKKSNIMLKEEDLAKHGFVPRDHSSPVSVLENINEHEDRSLHPKKHVRKILQAEDSTRKEGGSSMAQQGSHISNVMSRKKLENIDNLVQKLRRVNSNHDEARVDYIASLCDDANPEHRYVSEILLASGLLLRDFSSNSTDLLQLFHSSGNPINPELYSVLEQTKASTLRNRECIQGGKKVQVAANKKFHRKLIFDTVNEILAKKLSFLSRPRPVKLVQMPLNAQKLLREICSEIEGLRSKNPMKSSFAEDDDEWKAILSEDVMNRCESWTNFESGISEDIVLHVERMVFKDLVKETVLGEIDGSKTKPSRWRIFTE